MSTTPIMGLDLPTPTLAPGPGWAESLNSNAEIVDAHDHASVGKKITTAAILIDNDLSFSSKSATQVYSVQLNSLPTAVAGNNKVTIVSGDLYFTDGSGNQIRLTASGGINIASVGTIGGDYGQIGVPAAATYSNTLKTFAWTQDAGVAAKMSQGSTTISFEAAGQNGVTRSAQSGSAAYTLSYPIAVPTLNSMEVYDASGVGTFKVITGTSNQVSVSFSAGAVTLSTPQNIHTGASPTFVGLTLSGLTASRAIVTDGSKALTSLQYTSANTASTLVSRGSSGEIAVGAFNAAGYSTLGDDAAPAFKVKKLTPSDFTLGGSSETTPAHGISSGRTRIKMISGCYANSSGGTKRPLRTGDSSGGDLGIIAWTDSTYTLRNGAGITVSYYDITIYITYEA